MIKKTIPMSCAALLAVAMPLSAAAEELTATEILEKSTESMAALESYASVTDMELTMPPLFEETEPVSLVIHSQEQVTLDPFALHQTITTSLPDGEETTELYWTEEGFFQKDPVEGWVQLPDDLFGDVEALIGMSMSGHLPAQAEAFSDELAVEDLGEAYLLTYEGDGKALMESAQSMLESGLGSDESGLLFDALLEDVTFNELSYETTIDKETFYVTEVTVLVNMDLTAEEETVNLTQSINVTFSDFNNVGPITVPAEVVEGAEPIDFDELEGEELTEGDEQSSDGGQAEGEELPHTASANPTYALGGFALAAFGGVLLITRRKSSME